MNRHRGPGAAGRVALLVAAWIGSAESSARGGAPAGAPPFPRESGLPAEAESEPAKVLAAAEARLERARREGDRTGETSALLALVGATAELERNAESVAYGEEVLPRLAAPSRWREQARVLDRLLLGYLRLSRFERAISRGIRGMALAEQVGDRALAARIAAHLGFVHKDLGNHEQALRLFRWAADAAGERPADDTYLMALNETGNLLAAGGRHPEALALQHRVLSLALQRDDPARVAFCLHDIGLTLAAQGRHREALAHMLAAQPLLRAEGRRRELVLGAGDLARQYVELGRPAEALRTGAEWIATARDAGMKVELAAVLEPTAEALAALGRPEEAYRHLAEAHRLRQEVLSERSARRIAAMQSGFEEERRRREIEGLRKDRALHALQANRERLLRNAVIVGLLLLLALLALLHNRYRLSLSARRRLEAAHREVRTHARALEEANARLAEAARTDPLTGLLNRRGLRERLDQEAIRARRSAAPFALVLLDLDHFKQINDRFGHDAGDRVLCAVARLLAAALRAQDAVGRWGGEEFLLLLPQTDLPGARAVAEKLRPRIEALDLRDGDTPLRVTATFGLAVGEGSLSVDDCIRRADQALYDGKRTGRNRIVASP